MAQGFKPNDEYEKMQFYYHPDHLGSSSYITNLDGEVSQHIEYVPLASVAHADFQFGEVFIDELEPWRKSASEGYANLLSRKSAAEGKANSNNTWNTPYLFNCCVNERQIKPSYICPSAANSRYTNAKAFDEETGMYYYGARYYEPRLSLWMSVDPFAEDYSALSAYSYCANNPINGIDVKGEKILLVNGYWKSGVLGRLIGSDAPKQQYWGAKFAQEAQKFFSDYSVISEKNYIDGSSKWGEI